MVKFCYGWKVEVVASNVAPLLCAASFLEMSDDLEPGNLISKTESFLSFVILTSWKETFQIFKSCESISSWAKDLQILKRCSEAVAWKALFRMQRTPAMFWSIVSPAVFFPFSSFSLIFVYVINTCQNGVVASIYMNRHDMY